MAASSIWVTFFLRQARYLLRWARTRRHAITLLTALVVYLRQRAVYRRHVHDSRRTAAATKGGNVSDLPDAFPREYVDVATTKGRVRGFRVDAPDTFGQAHHLVLATNPHKSVNTFRGIPYAEPPVGARRFLRSIPKEPWDGVKDCTKFGKSSIQSDFGLHLFGMSVPELIKMIFQKFVFGWGLNLNVNDPKPIESDQSEDCLTLNVCTPSLDPDAKLPVAVWLHGGAFVLGAGSEALYSQPWGNRIAQKGVVAVTVNYRLGALGFLKVEGGDYNCGLWDQVRALQWIREEIRRFGGDPYNVTLYGESAGAMSTGCLLSSPIANRYFRRAVLQSGACYNVIDRQDNVHMIKLVKHVLSIDQDDTKSLWDCPADRVHAAQERVRILRFFDTGTLPFQPVVDGELIPRPPMDSIHSGVASHIDIIVGYNKHEWKLFIGIIEPIMKLFPRLIQRRIFAILMGPTIAGTPDNALRVTEELFERYKEEYVHLNRKRDAGMATRGTSFLSLSTLAGGKTGTTLSGNYSDADLKAHTPLGGEVFTPFSPMSDDVQVDWHNISTSIHSDLVFRAPAILLAHAHAHAKSYGVKTYKYRFDFENDLGACHGLDVPFVHGTFDRHNVGLAKFVIKAANRSTEKAFQEELLHAERLSDVMMCSWANFFRTGDPSVPELEFYWPQFSLSDGETMIFNTKNRCELLVQNAYKWSVHDYDNGVEEEVLETKSVSQVMRRQPSAGIPKNSSFTQEHAIDMLCNVRARRPTGFGLTRYDSSALSA